MNNLQSTWISLANDASIQNNNFVIEDKKGNSFILEWMKGNILSPELGTFKKDLSDFAASELTLSELSFLKAHPESVSSELFLMSSSSLLQNGFENANWDAISETIKSSITQFYQADLSKFGDEVLKPLLNDVYFFATLKSSNKEPLGFLLFSITPQLPFGDVKVINFFVKPNLGLEKMLMTLIFKILPLTKRIFLFVRPTNTKAIEIYSSIGFQKDENPFQDPNHKTSNTYSCLEYQIDNSNILQQ